MNVQDHLEIGLIRRSCQRLWIPCRSNLYGLDIAVDAQRAFVLIASCRLYAHKAFLLSTRCEWGWRLRLDIGDVVDDGEDDARGESLAERPLRMLPAVACKVLDDEEGETEKLEAQRSEYIGALDGLVGQEGHCLGE